MTGVNCNSKYSLGQPNSALFPARRGNGTAVDTGEVHACIGCTVSRRVTPRHVCAASLFARGRGMPIAMYEVVTGSP